jgi:hypothetical protein
MLNTDKEKAIRKLKYLFEYKVNETPSFNYSEKKFGDDAFPNIEEADEVPGDAPTDTPQPEVAPTPEQPTTEVPATPAPTPEVVPPAPETPIVPETPVQPVATAPIPQEGSEMDEISKKMDIFITSLVPLSQKLDALDSRMNGIDSNLTTKIDTIESDVKDIKKPTPEQLYQMSSLHSTPFNIRLDKYWNEKYGKDVVGINGEEKPKEMSINVNEIPPMSDNEFKSQMNSL